MKFKLTRLKSRESSLRAGHDGIDSDGASLAESSSDCPVPADSTIWVNLFDPINGPSFKPSPLKPIPLFMRRPLIPAIEAQRQPSVMDAYLQTPSPLNSPGSRASTICPARSTPPSLAESRAASVFSIGQVSSNGSSGEEYKDFAPLD